MTFLYRLFALWLLLTSLGHAATNPRDQRAPLTAKEVAQGYRDHVLLAMPRASARATVDAAEIREGVRVRRAYARFGGLRVFDLDSTESPATALSRLKATGRYQFVEPDYLRIATVLPSDPRFNPDQWPLQNSGASAGVVGADIRAVTAWDTLHDAPNIIVAVIDSGLLATHEDIAANLWTNSGEIPGNGLDDDNDGYIDDVHGINSLITRQSPSAGNPLDDLGHGTHVAGIIGAVGNNALGIAGVAWRVKIMPLKFLGSGGTGTVSDEIECFDYALAHGAHLINGSFGDTTGSTAFSQSELAAITRARDAGLIFVAAAGNDSINLDITRQYPAGFPLDNILTVASSNRRDERSIFSSYGSGAADLFAPGEDILSLGYTTTNGYVLKSGTSMAAPHVTGALALLKARFPSDTYRQLMNRVLRNVDPGANFAGKCQTGGRLNLARALASTDSRPFNDDFTTHAQLTGANIAARASSSGATRESGEPVHAGATGSASLWWQWTAPSSGIVTIDTIGSTFDTVLAIYTGAALSGLTPVSSNDDSGDVTSRVTFSAQAGTVYQIAVDGKAGASGLVLVNIGTVPANDAFADPITLTGVSVLVTGTNAHCSRESGEPRILGATGGLSLWYRWTAPVTGRFQAAAFSSQIDPLLAVYTGTSLASLTVVTASDNSGEFGTEAASLCTFNATAGTTYYLTVDSKNAGVPGTFTLTLVDSLWQAVTADAITGSPAVSRDGTICVGSTDSSLYAFNPDGSTRWSFPTAGFIDTCSPAIADDGTIYTGSNDGKVRAFTPTGTLKWTFTVPTPADASLSTSISNSPAIGTDGTIYLQSTDHYLYALNPTDGAQKWRFDTNSISYSSPVIAPDGTIYIGSTDSNLYALNPGGSLKWTFPAGNQIYSTPALDAAGNIYFGTLGNTFVCVTTAGTQRWLYTAGGSISSSPALSPDGAAVYFGAYDRKLHALHTATGLPKWTYALGDEVRASSPAVDANGVIYLGSYDSLLHAVNPDGTLLRTYATGHWVRSSPVIAGTKLFVGSNDGKLYAFELGVAAANSPWPMYRHNPRRLGRSVAAIAPAVTTQPQSRIVAVGSTAVFAVESLGTDVAYQWKKNGANLPGATSPRLIVTDAQNASAGSYTVSVTNSFGSTETSSAATLSVITTADPGRLVNLSIRGTSGTGSKVLIMGFVTGPSALSGSISLLLRGSGETLVTYGVPDAISDPAIQVIPFGSAVPLATNDNWGGTTELKTATAATGAFAFLNDTSKDAALLGSLPRGPYSVIVTGNNATTGPVLAEIYDANLAGTYSSATPRLVNLSARAYASGADNLIAGFVILGTTAKTVLIRAIGPDQAFAQFFPAGQVLGDPRLDVYRTQSGVSTRILSNDNWGGDPQLTSVAQSVGAFPLANLAGKDATVLATLDPGVYSALVVPLNSTTGIALVEIYEMP